MIRPIRGHVFAEIIFAEKVLPSGLILSDNVREKPHRARVIAVGGPWLDRKGKEYPVCCRPGDIVHFRKPYGKYVTWEGKRCVVLHSEKITGVEHG